MKDHDTLLKANIVRLELMIRKIQVIGGVIFFETAYE